MDTTNICFLSSFTANGNEDLSSGGKMRKNANWKISSNETKKIETCFEEIRKTKTFGVRYDEKKKLNKTFTTFKVCLNKF